MSTDNLEIPKALSGTGAWLDDRFHGARGVRVLMRKVFPDHWSFMLGEIALWSFVILLLTGTFLSFFFVPSMTDVVYHGSYVKLDGIRMSEAMNKSAAQWWISRMSSPPRTSKLMFSVDEYAWLIWMPSSLA